MKSKILLLSSIILVIFSLCGCGTLNEFLEKNVFSNNSNDLDSIYEEYMGEIEFENSAQSQNYELTVYDIETINPDRNAFISLKYEWIQDNTKTLVRVNYYIIEGTIEYDLENYNELEPITIGDKTFSLMDNNDTYILYYRKDNKAYLKIEMYAIQTIDTKSNEMLETIQPKLNFVSSDDFKNVVNFEFKLKEDSTLITDSNVEILIAPEVEQEVDYTEKEFEYIYKLIYSEEMAQDVIERLNKLGIYGISSATLIPSQGEYLVEVVDKTKTHYFVHINMYKHTYGVQKDSDDGEYIYLESN